MSKLLGRGLLQSLRARVDADVHDLIRENKSLRRARYGWGQRLLKSWIVGHPVVAVLSAYCVSIGILILAEWLESRFAPCLYGAVSHADFSKDAAGFFLSAQIGILAVLTVAISVVTLLTQKDDGSAVNTDVRLYYVESYSHELAASGILLSGAVVLQLFWPLQPLVVLLAGGEAVEQFKLCITAVHATWLILNLYLFLHFINMTLKFVEPPSRARLRKQYSANEIIPRDVRRRLMAVYYGNAPAQLLGVTELREGPHVSFGMGLISSEQAVTEISRSFNAPSRLVDVWLLPLGFALRRWHQRTRKQGQSRSQFDQIHWDGDLAILINLQVVQEEKFDLVVRKGGVPLTWLERFLVGISFRFAKVDLRVDSLPTPTDFIEQLISKVVNQIEVGAPNGFNDTLKEAVDFHSFALDAQNTRDESGGLVNLAQVSDGLFRQPDFEWIREYRRAYTASINQMASDGWFVQGMSGLVVRLWPGEPVTFPPSVLTNILELGRIQIAAFEAWVTKRAIGATPEGQFAPDLAGSDLRAYEDALIHFVSSWERLEQEIISSFEIRRSARMSEEAYWQAASTSWPSLQMHMRNAAYFLAAAVWNEDLVGSVRFRDLLVRWVQAFYAQLQNVYPFRDALILTPDLLRVPWADAEAAAVRSLIFPQPPLAAKTVFGIVLREAHLDAIAITGAVLMHWFATKQQPSPAAAQTAILTLRREPQPGSGSTLLDQTSTKKSIFRLVFDLLIREALHSPFEEANYSSYLDGLIRLLNEMATPRMIPGRIYGGFALDGFQTLTPEFLAILAGNLPTGGDGGIAELIQRLLSDHPKFQLDRTLRDFEFQFRRYATALDDGPDERFTVTVECFVDGPDFTALRATLKAIFDSVTSAIHEHRLERIRQAPIDKARLETVRDAVESALLANQRPMGGFPSILVDRTNRPVEVHETDWGVMDRGAFTQPEMTGVTFGDLPLIFVEMTENYLRNIGWHELNHRQKTVEEIDSRLGVAEFLDHVIKIAENPELGHELILFVPNELIGNAIYMTTSGFPTEGLEDYGLTREVDADGGTGCAYAGTLGNIHFYIWPFPDAAILCSRTLLRAVHFGCARNLDEIFDFEFYDSGDPTKSRVRIWLGAEFEWEDRAHVQFVFTDSAVNGQNFQ